MCGIAGAMGPRERVDQTMVEVRRMTTELRRRGPDGAGFQALGGVVFGHARLAIIDLETGDQPQSNHDGTVWCTVNGEIYNYVELREDLESRGHVFKTDSDVEVIPHLYDEYGAEFVQFLRGMFAIALYDTRRDTMFLVRDRMGKKPLYWIKTDECVYFASEIKALMQVPEIDLTIDPQAIEDYFTFQYIPAPRTIFKEVQKIPAAHLIRIKGRDIESFEYWTLPQHADDKLTEIEAIERLEHILDEATRIRLRSDVPLGAFLSGGIDSGLVVDAAQRISNTPIRTTTVSFGPENEDELAIAAGVARRLGTDHHVKTIHADVVESLHKVTSYLDEPLADSSTLPTYLLSRATREDVTVAISGDGGDETFGGYAWRYYQNLFLERMRRFVPGRAGQKVLSAIANVYPKADRLPKPLRLKWALRNLSVDAQEAYFLDMSVIRPEDKSTLYRPELSRAIGDYRAKEVLDRHFKNCDSDDLLTKMLYVDLKTYLAEGVLAKVDRMSMANSLEVRAPLLDHKLVEFSAMVPSSLKFQSRTSKYLLRRLAEKRLGNDPAKAPKVGFAPPIANWLRGELAELFRDCVLESPQGVHFLVENDVARRMFDEHCSGRKNRARPLWSLLCFELWYRHFGVKARFSY